MTLATKLLWNLTLLLETSKLVKFRFVCILTLSISVGVLCRYVGKLVGRYYDYRGKPTKYLKSAEAKAARGAQLMEKQKKEEEKIPNCNSKWSEHEGGEVRIFR